MNIETVLKEKFGEEAYELMVRQNKVISTKNRWEAFRNCRNKLLDNCIDSDLIKREAILKVIARMGEDNKQFGWGFNFPGWLGELQDPKDIMFISQEPHIVTPFFQIAYNLYGTSTETPLKAGKRLYVKGKERTVANKKDDARVWYQLAELFVKPVKEEEAIEAPAVEVATPVAAEPEPVSVAEATVVESPVAEAIVSEATVAEAAVAEVLTAVEEAPVETALTEEEIQQAQEEAAALEKEEKARILREERAREAEEAANELAKDEARKGEVLTRVYTTNLCTFAPFKTGTEDAIQSFLGGNMEPWEKTRSKLMKQFLMKEIHAIKPRYIIFNSDMRFETLLKEFSGGITEKVTVKTGHKSLKISFARWGDIKIFKFPPMGAVHTSTSRFWVNQLEEVRTFVLKYCPELR